MKLRVFFLLFLTSDLFIEASLIPRSVASLRDRISARRRRKKPVEEVKDDGWPKYFHEPGGNELSNHYDSRYEHGVLSYEDKQDTQVHMMRAYLDFFKQNGVETWLAHGTLLGWWWNGKMLPWDWDIDTQVSLPTISYLGKHFNGSIYDYSSKDSDPDSDPVVERQYLLDVNPAIIERDRGNGNNVIDARWIDIRNGLYIDVTALSETEPVEHPGIWTCKNYHHYRTTDLYPMRETMYEGVVTKVPYAYDRILAEEYQEKALVVTDYQGHKWHPEIKEWVKKTPAEIKQERLDRQAARRKKQEEKAQKKKEKLEKAEQQHQEERVKFEAEQKAKAEGQEEAEVQDDHGIKEPDKEPGKIKREADANSALDAHDEPVLEEETSGLAHLRRQRRPLTGGH
ncbi:mannosyltransferase [Lecanora helva]